MRRFLIPELAFGEKEVSMIPPIGVRVPGSLEPYVGGFWAELLARGYSVLSAQSLIRVMAHLSRWLHGHHVRPRELTAPRIEQYLKARRRAGCRAWVSERGLAPLLGFLRRLQVVPVPRPRVARTALDRLLVRYGDYLRRERGLVPSYVRVQEVVARRFLLKHRHPERLDARDVTGFVLRECRDRSVQYTKHLVAALRSLLRFLYLEGKTPIPLATAVPPIVGWRDTSLPRALEPEHVMRLLRSCDRRTAVGRRDYAILMLLVRLGLRRGEVAALQLSDIDWRHGEIAIRGKGRQLDRLPLPVDVGEALIGYLRLSRRRIACPSVFLRVQAPLGALSSQGIGDLLHKACRRAQLPRIGAHRLRHTAATHMLRGGASLSEIAQVLRHRSLLTTAIYAKVDRTALRLLAQPWPGECR
jgi:site-specific recombinase XerD